MGHRSAPQLTRYLPQVLLATFLVAVCPSLVVWALRSAGLLGWWGFSLVLGVALSALASCAGAAYWKTRAGSEDLLFGEVMIWGWVRRWRIERRLSSAAELLGLGDNASASGSEATSAQRKAQLLRQMAAALEAQDPYTHGHSRRVARHAAMIAKQMGLPRAQVNRIRAAAVVHDVGKVNTPVSVLHKPGRLSDAEFEIVKRHPVDGAQMVSSLGDPELTAIVRHHHERLDGTGYPAGLSAHEIPMGARIIAVADTFDAITSRRPYRSASPHKKALAILDREAGTQLDPGAVRAFRRVYAPRRPLAVWALLTSFPERLVGLAGSNIDAIAAGSAARVLAVAAGSAVVGTAALGTPTAGASRLPARTHQAAVGAPAHHRRSEAPSSAGRMTLARWPVNQGQPKPNPAAGGISARRAAGQLHPPHRVAAHARRRAPQSPLRRISPPPAPRHPLTRVPSARTRVHPPRRHPAVSPVHAKAPAASTQPPPASAGSSTPSTTPGSVAGTPGTKGAGNSANAPGHSPTGPGNSPNAPGHTKSRTAVPPLT